MAKKEKIDELMEMLDAGLKVEILIGEENSLSGTILGIKDSIINMVLDSGNYATIQRSRIIAVIVDPNDLKGDNDTANK